MYEEDDAAAAYEFHLKGFGVGVGSGAARARLAAGVGRGAAAASAHTRARARASLPLSWPLITRAPFRPALLLRISRSLSALGIGTHASRPHLPSQL